MKTLLQENIDSLNQVCQSLTELEKKQLATLNKLRKMNGKKSVSSFEEHRKLKKLGL